MGWALAERLAARGESVAYVDIDQLGMCYPGTADDPDRWNLKEQALVRVTDRYRSTGVARLIVPGVALPQLPPPGHPELNVRSLWLDAAAEVRRERLGPREWDAVRAAEVVRIGTDEAARLDPSWERLDTDELTLDATVDAVLSRWTWGTAASGGSALRPAADVDPQDPSSRDHGSGRLLWITGPRCAGASTVGWLIAKDAWQRGRWTGFIDVDQLTYTWNVELPVGLANGVALHDAFAADGCDSCIVVAPLDLEPRDIRAAFGGLEVSVVRLDATDADLGDRAVARTRRWGAHLPDDDLVGCSAAQAKALISAAVARQRIDARRGETLVDTSGLDAATTKERVIAAVTW